MSTNRFYAKEIQNRNYLSPVGFKFALTKYPKVSFLANRAQIPSITAGTAIQPSYLKDVNVPGDKLVYDDFQLTFIVDENMENYMSIHNWLVGLTYPESVQQFTDQIAGDMKNLFSEGTLLILNSSFQTQTQVKFRELFPVSLTPLEFLADETETNYFTATASFKYTIYNIFAADGRTPL